MDDGEKAIVAVSSSPSEAQSQISSLLQDMWLQLQEGMENTLKMASEIEQSSIEITEELEKCRESADAKSKLLEDDKVGVQRAIFTVLQVLGTDAI